MPNIGATSRVVQPNEYVNPIDLNILQHGIMYKEGVAKENLQNINNAWNTLSSIPAQGKDAEVLQQKLKAIKESLASIPMGNLSDYNTAAQIEGIIKNTVNEPQVFDIAQKWTPVQKEQERKRKAEEKGEIFISPMLDDANEYIQKGEYIEGKRFGSSGWLSPNTEKMKTEALKNIKPDKKNVKVGNYWQEQEFLSKEKVQPVLDQIYSNPAVVRDMEYKIEQSAKSQGVDFEKYARQDLQGLILEAQNVLKTNPNDENAIKAVSLYSTILNDPTRLASSAKQIYLNDKIKEEKLKDLAQLTYIQEGKMDADDFAVKAQEHRNNLIEAQAKELSLGASMMNKSLTEVMSNPQLMAQAATLSQQAKLAEFSQKENIKLQNKLADKENAVKGGFKFTNSETITYTDEKGDSKTLQYGTFKEEIRKAPKETAQRMIAAALNKKNSTDGSWIPLTPAQVTIIGEGNKRKIKIKAFYGFGGEKIPIDDVIDISNFTKPSSQSDSTFSSNPKGEITLEDGSKVQAPILQSVSDTSKLQKGEYAIINGEAFIKE